MRGVVVDSPHPAVVSLGDRLAESGVEHFVDMGCGAGTVLCDVAARFPAAHCIGVDLDDRALAAAEARSSGLGLSNVAFVQADVMDCVTLAEDVVYLYLGGALNQRLGSALIDRVPGIRVFALRYPIVGRVASARYRGEAGNDVFEYDTTSTSPRAEWDAYATSLVIPPYSRYLLGRALRVDHIGPIDLQITHRRGDAVIRGYEFGAVACAPGQPIVLDCLIDGGEEASEIDLTLTIDGARTGRPHRISITPGAAPTEVVHVHA